MKNFTLISNIVLAIAVAILFYLHFATCKQCSAPTANKSVIKQGNNFKIAYFDLDSLQNNFDYYKQVAKELGNSEQQKRNELSAKKDAYVAKVKEYQAKGQAMSQAEVAAAQQDIQQREKDYQQDEQSKSQEMQEESFKRLQDVKKKIEDSAHTVVLNAQKHAEKAGVYAKTMVVKSSVVSEGLIKTAISKKADLIVMASHGRNGINRLLLGSETLQVLTHSKIDVLVLR